MTSTPAIPAARVLRQHVMQVVSGLRSLHPADVASLLCMAALSAVMLATLPDYGLTYDEEPHILYGERVLGFYTGTHPLTPALTQSSYGPGFDVLAALLRRISPWDEFQTNHALCMWVAEAGLLGTWQLGRLVAGPWSGLCSLLFLVLTPVYYGHQFNNPKDIPFAAGYVWALYFLARLGAPGAGGPALRGPEEALAGWLRRGSKYWLCLGLMLALGMMVRVGGAILIGYLVLLLVGLALDSWRTQGRAGLRAVGSLAIGACASVVGACSLVIVAWPRALAQPLKGPAAALETVTRFTKYDSPTLLAGRSISSNRVPWDYLPTYFSLQLPEFLSACAVGTFFGVVVVSVRRWRRRAPLPWAYWLLLWAALLPPAYAISRGSTLYNGLRHFLFVIPPLSVLAGAGLATLAGKLAAWRPRAGHAVAGLFLVFVIDQARAMWLLHPHQHVFFNRASGGIAAAVGRYETEYYGSVYQELLGKLRERIWQERRDGYLNTTFDVSGCGSKLFFTRNLPLNFRYRGMRRAARSDFYATYVRDGCLKRFRDRGLITSVERGGAALAVARDMKRKVPRSKPATSRSSRR